ncbi:MAG: DEAD/DEAH box helicase [Acidobacteria bacterium]|nr:DEAD/DEAH box helicase [Acidobacteriota bacterium]
MSFDVGALVRARGREWVVLPQNRDDPDTLILRPLGGTEHEVTGIYLPLERVEPAQFDLPDPATDLGNHLSFSLLRDAVRLGFRAGAGPFRSLARIAVEPRPYQLVPLLMALRLDPVRLLIADDVGVGKTVEACLVARELVDRCEVDGLCVLCPPHLAEQWQASLAGQFHLDAELVLAGTAARLERTCRQDESLFDRYPFTVVSTDYIKSERRRDEFLRACPDLVIVDEAHTCATATTLSSGQQRHELLQALVRPDTRGGASRHLVLVTATPHSGNEETFRSLLVLLDNRFADLPADLSGEQNRGHREALARHFVQRRRGDLKAYLDTVTPFPTREIAEEHYTLTPRYREFLDRVLGYCRESVLDKSLERRRQRVRWWSALALLRALASSPAAAAATLRNRSVAEDAETIEQVDEEGRRAVLDLDEDLTEAIDVVSGCESEEDADRDRGRLMRLAREADELAGEGDAKLSRALELVRDLLDDGYAPIVFCRFVPTVDYVAAFLRARLERRGVVVEAVTGRLPPEERKRRVEALGAHEGRILVCTDCLSEGINLQDAFDAVMHYDLSWNPTRHEQREGRVDRYGQNRSTVRTLTYYGQNNPVDGIVLQVLLRKHKTIHERLGVIVPVPMDTRIIEDAVLEGLLMREADTTQLSFDFLEPLHRDVDGQWDAAVEREKRSRTLFAQNQILRLVNTEVRVELDELRRAIGSGADVRRFTATALRTLGAQVSGNEPMQVDMRETTRALRDAIGEEGRFVAVFSGAPERDAHRLTRTHPIVEGLAAHVLEIALDRTRNGLGLRCGVVRTNAVQRRTTLVLLRVRFHIVNRGRDDAERPLLAEELALAGFRGSPDHADWLAPDDIEPFLDVGADANIGADQAQTHIQRVLDRLDALRPRLDAIAEERGRALFDAHRRVRRATRSGVRALRVDVHTPPDVLGVYMLLPVVAGGHG